MRRNSQSAKGRRTPGVGVSPPLIGLLARYGANSASVRSTLRRCAAARFAAPCLCASSTTVVEMMLSPKPTPDSLTIDTQRRAYWRWQYTALPCVAVTARPRVVLPLPTRGGDEVGSTGGWDGAGATLGFPT